MCAEKGCTDEACDEVMCCEPEAKRWKRVTLIGLAMLLAVFSILYSLFEGSVSVAFGASSADSLTLIEFGTDSLIEVAAGVVVLVKCVFLFWKSTPTNPIHPNLHHFCLGFPVS